MMMRNLGPSPSGASTNNARGVCLAKLGGLFFLFVLAVYLRHVWLPEGYLRQTDGLAVEEVPQFTAPVAAVVNATSDGEVLAGDVAGEKEENAAGRKSKSSHFLQTSQPQASSHSDSCRIAPGAERVMVVLKTGATELYQKLPVHLVTTLRCIPHFMIFSDVEEELGEYRVHDALSSITKELRDHYPDFELYRKLQQYRRDGQDMRVLQGDVSWNLDKWKFLPMLHRAWETAKNEIDWFVFIEADTSLSWTNLLQWLKMMDPNEPFYLGSQNFIGSTAFAHGGSGIVISRKAADMLQELRAKEGRTTYDKRWETDLATQCCGDEVLARALLEANVNLTPSWPSIQGETIASLNWSERHWCTPAITWHHVTPSELDALWHFERAWVDGHGWNEPFLFRDIFAHFVEPHISVNRTSWTNLSKDRKLANESFASAVGGGAGDEWPYLQDFEREATMSREGCAQACVHPKYKEECVQWMFSPGRCNLGFSIRFGRSDEREEEHWTSGWVRERLEEFKYGLLGCKVAWEEVVGS